MQIHYAIGSHLVSTPRQAETLRRLHSARAETEIRLKKAKSYAHHLQKPEQIRFYEAHIAWLTAQINEDYDTVPPAKADGTKWDQTREQAA